MRPTLIPAVIVLLVLNLFLIVILHKRGQTAFGKELWYLTWAQLIFWLVWLVYRVVS